VKQDSSLLITILFTDATLTGVTMISVLSVMKTKCLLVNYVIKWHTTFKKYMVLKSLKCNVIS